MTVRADLHTHSCVSPCADLSMSPPQIVRAAESRGMALLAITDHNTAAHSRLLFQLCRGTSITPVAGLEITTAEEIHVLALFATPDQAEDLADSLFNGVAQVENDPELYGDQPVVDQDENILRFVRGFLGSPTRYPLAELGREIHERNGLFIPAHIDRSIFSVMSQLGFLPEDDYDAVEVTCRRSARRSPAAMTDRSYPEICSSDAHVPEDIARSFVEFDAPEPSFSHLKRALERNAVRIVR